MLPGWDWLDIVAGCAGDVVVDLGFGFAVMGFCRRCGDGEDGGYIYLCEIRQLTSAVTQMCVHCERWGCVDVVRRT